MKKAVGLLATWALSVGGVVAVTAQSGRTAIPAPFSALPDQALAGYSTGTDVHVGLLQSGTTQLAHAEVAFTGASVASQGTNTRPAFGPGVGASPGQIVNEMGQVVQPHLPGAGLLTGDRSFGRGSAVEVGLGNPIPNDNSDIVLPPRVQASAPPDHVPTTPPGASSNAVDALCQSLLQVPVNPLLYAQVLQDKAAARWADNVNNCIVGAPYGEGQASAARVQLLDTTGAAAPSGPLGAPLVSTDAPQPNRNAAQTWSNTRLVNQTLA